MVKQGQDPEFFIGSLAEETIPFYRFVKKGTGDTQFLLSDADEIAVGVSELNPNLNNLDGSTRTGYIAKEKMKVRRRGIAIVEASAAISAGAYVKSAANGKAVTYTKQTVTAGGPTAAEVTAIRDQAEICHGKALTAAAKDGDLIEVDLGLKP